MSCLRNNGGQFSYSPPSVKYKGLVNQGATSYLNSVLQVLFMTEDFREAVERYPGTECIDLQLKTLFGKLCNQTADTCDITEQLGIKRVDEQQDAAEYFEKILNLSSDEASQIFYGKLAHRATCSVCDTQNDTDGKFWHLPLLLDSCSEYNVENGIEEYFGDLRFSGENQMYCDQCDAKYDATISCVIKDHPEVLMLLLKRFELDYYSRTYFKNNLTVHIPRILQIPENQTYELYAVVEHVGDLRSGHYTACIKSQEDDRWYKFDDARVTLVDSQLFQTDNSEKSDSAYLLFYRKKSVPAADTSSSEVIREVFTLGGCSSSTSDKGQDVVMVDEQEEVQGAVEARNDAAVVGFIDPYGADEQGGEKRVKGDFKAASEVKMRADKGKTVGRKLLTKFDLVFNNMQENVGSSSRDMAQNDQAWKRGSGSRYEQHREEKRDVQRAKEEKRRDDEHSKKRATLMSVSEATHEGSSDDCMETAHRFVCAAEKQEKAEDRERIQDRDSSSGLERSLSMTDVEGGVGKTQAGAEFDKEKKKSGTCIVRIYEEETRETQSVTLRSREKMDIKLQTLLTTFLDGGKSESENRRKRRISVPFSGEAFPLFLDQEVRNQIISCDVRNLLAKFSQEKQFGILKCQSPAQQNNVT
ncbi:uncharacterized protein LOC117807073 isoform X2 [Notolabrus celidotus]|uniref:uncharacterized protein LOC117807073 isoform X2 n=1 Tax=Notolabrus celidotus TaxID=1203425 RepID=UPI0014900AC3|nr:uncharacterized protein LOC117807073 isoform X2 [Notolabrus celidotus]